MFSATRALARARQHGTPLPEIDALHDLYRGYYQLQIRGAQQTMIAGQPGSQKSGFAVFLTAEWAKRGVSVLYVSGDMDQHTAATRLTAALTGYTTRSISEALEAGAEDYYAEALAHLPVRFMFNPNPSISEVRCELDAWVEMWDEYPKVIVLDNLLDIVPAGGDNEFTGYKSILLDGKSLARETNAAVLILHHMSEAGSEPNRPAPRKLVMGKVSQTPENVLSVALEEGTGRFHVAVVKQRNGPSDASAQRVESLAVYPARNGFERALHVTVPTPVWQAKEET